MGSRETWEILLLPVGEVAGGGMASVNNIDPGPPSGLQGGGSAQGRIRTPQALTEPVGETNKPKAMRGQEVVAP